MSVRVHELAKELKWTSKELIAKLKTLKIAASSHMTVLTDDHVKRLKSALAKTPSPAAVKPSAPVKSQSTVNIERPRETSSIENAKKELLLRRAGIKAAHSAPPIKKIHQAAPPPPPIRRTLPIASAKTKHVQGEAKKVSSAAVVETAAPEKSTGGLGAFTSPSVATETKKMRKTELAAPITVKDLAAKLFVRPNDVIQRLIKLNIFANINQAVDFDIAGKIALDFGFEITKPAVVEETAQGPRARTADGRPFVTQATPEKSLLKGRAPIVTFMGHVDHGKTSLLDAIRKTKVAASEAGGITQHIGAYEVFLPKGAVTFLDTPGHEAFTAMRARGARVTDVVVLVVAADDGVMPQTIEAIDHAKAAGVPIIVAINKIDLPSANMDRAKKGLMEQGLTPEDWGGKTVMIGVSAKTGQGIDELLEMLALESELLELKANQSAPASGVVVEAELSKESGVLATVLVQDGALHVGDVVVVGAYYCKVRAMINDRGQRIKEALPSMPVEILGLPGVPRAGDRFFTVKDERAAKEIMDKKLQELRDKGVAAHVTLEQLYEDIKAGKVEELKLIIKSDVQGSLEALTGTLSKIQSKNVRFSIIHSGIGDISESDVMLAAASNAVVIGFHVGIVGTAKEAAGKEQVDVRFYDIIYEIKTAIEKAMEGLLEPELAEVFVGSAEVRQVFKVSKVGTVAGCSVAKGKIVRNFPCRVIRNGQKIHEGKVESLKRFKDDAREVLEGFECGIGVSNFEELQAGDRIEVYEVQKKARKLE